MVGNESGAAIDVVSIFGNKTTPTAISPSVTTVWSWNNSLNRWNFFAPDMTAQELSIYATSKNYGVLSSIAKGSGFWVNAKSQFVYSPVNVASVDVAALQRCKDQITWFIQSTAHLVRDAQRLVYSLELPRLAM